MINFSKSKKTLIVNLIVFLFIATIGSSVAYYIGNIIGNIDNTINVTTIKHGDIIVSYPESNSIINVTSKDLNISDEATTYAYYLKFNIQNTGNISTNITINWLNLTNTFCQYRDNDFNCTNTSSDTYVGNELAYALYTCTTANYNGVTVENIDTNCTKISNPIDQGIPSTGNTTKLHTALALEAPEETTKYYVLLIKLTNLTVNQNYNLEKSLTTGVEIKRVKGIEDALLEDNKVYPDNISSTYVSSNTGIDFTDVNSPTNGQGLYTNVKNSQDGETKYFRGGTYCTYTGYTSEDENGTNCLAAGGTWTNYHCNLNDNKTSCETAGGTYYELKNNIMFGGYAWKIIRINSDGSIRMIYNGTSPYDRYSNTLIGLSPYDKSTTDIGTATTLDISLNELSYTGGNLKDEIDTWYNENLSNYDSYLADSTFCNDLNYTTGTIYYFGSRNRYVAGTPSFNCESNNTYTVANGNLSVPTATINADESTYAGGKYATHNYTYFLQNGYSYWSISPYNYNTSELATYGLYIHTYGYVEARILKNELGARPVINLSPNVMISSGIGTLDNPFIVAN